MNFASIKGILMLYKMVQTQSFDFFDFENMKGISLFF